MPYGGIINNNILYELIEWTWQEKGMTVPIGLLVTKGKGKILHSKGKRLSDQNFALYSYRFF